MINPIEEPEHHHHHRRHRATSAGMCGGGYGLGVIGAAVYFLQHATTFGEGVVAILKALVWPAFLVYHVLEFLKM